MADGNLFIVGNMLKKNTYDLSGRKIITEEFICSAIFHVDLLPSLPLAVMVVNHEDNPFHDLPHTLQTCMNKTKNNATRKPPDYKEG